MQKSWRCPMSKITQSQRKAWANQEQTFIEDAFEIAFGDNAIYKDYSFEEVLKRLRDFSKKAYAFDEEMQLKELQEKLEAERRGVSNV